MSKQMIQTSPSQESNEEELQPVPIPRKLYSVYTREKFSSESLLDSLDGLGQSGISSPQAEGEGPSHPQPTPPGTAVNSRTLVERILGSQEVIPAIKRPSGEGDQVSSANENDSDNLGHLLPHLITSASMFALVIWLIS